MSDEFGDYAGDDQHTIAMMMGICALCECDVVFDPDEGYIDPHDGRPCPSTETGEHEPIVSDKDLKWEVCGTCRGKGTSSLYLGSFSAEVLWEDPDFAEDYMEGRYDRPCPECGGRTTVRAIRSDAKHSDQIEEWFKDMHEMRAEEAAERRAGA